jgi:hypothetical protein
MRLDSLNQCCPKAYGLDLYRLDTVLGDVIDMCEIGVRSTKRPVLSTTWRSTPAFASVGWTSLTLLPGLAAS